MTADERLARIRVKVERAKEHIVDLNAALGRFKHSQPYTFDTKRNPQTRQLVYYVTSVKEIPPIIPAIAGDIVHNLRGALDHLAYQLFALGPDGQAGKPGSHIYFPIYDTFEKYEAGVGSKTKGIPEKAVKAITSVEPYKGGKGHLLWSLHQLDITDKHRLLVTIQINLRSVNPFRGILKRLNASARAQWETSEMRERGFPPPEFPTLDLFLNAADKVALQVGTELFINSPDAEADDEVQILCEISLNEPGIGESQPITEFLKQMIDFVDNLIGNFRRFLA